MKNISTMHRKLLMQKPTCYEVPREEGKRGPSKIESQGIMKERERVSERVEDNQG